MSDIITGGEIAKAAMQGVQVTITPDCYPLRGKVREISITATQNTWNGIVTLGRTISAEAEPEQLDAAIVRTIREMAETMDLPHKWEP